MRQILPILCCFLVHCHTKVVHKPIPGSPCNVTQNKTDVICNCQKRSLTVIPEHLPRNTTILHLDHNDINAVHRGQLFHYNKLRKLSLAHNKISQIENNSLDGLRNLQELDISGNNIQHIPDHTFTFLRNLKKLDIGSNLFNVTPDNALNLPRLESLTLASLNKNGDLHGSVIGAGFNRLLSLQNLGRQDNGLHTLKNGYFTHMHKISLQTINLAANNLTKIESQAFDEIQTVKNVIIYFNDFNHTDIEESLHGIYITNITSLSLQWCKNLHSITNTTFKYLKRTRVESLDLGHSVFAHIPDNAFNNITTLESINLGSNNFTELSNHSFACLPNLKNVLLGNNHWLTHLNSAFVGVNLTKLDLSQTGIEQIPNGTFYGTNKLTHLSLSDNLTYLYNDSFLGLTSLTYLDLSDNLNVIQYDLHAFRGLDSLDTLFITGMEISNFTTPICEDLKSLKHLIADNIRIRHLPDDLFKHCQNLFYMSMKGCPQLRDIGYALRNIPNLKFLDLSVNTFNELKPGAFNINDKFGTLIYKRITNASNNKPISKISSAILESSHMDVLDISSNGIEHLTDTDINFFSKLKSLVAYNNSYDCSCDSLDLIKWFQANLDKIKTMHNYYDYRCSTPNEMMLKHKTLKNFNTYVCWIPELHFLYEFFAPFTVLVLFVSVVGVSAYRKQSMFRYFYYHYSTQDAIEEANAEDLRPFITYDAFISYRYGNLDFVKEILLKNLEGNEHLATIFKQLWDDIEDITNKLSICVSYCCKVYTNNLDLHNGGKRKMSSCIKMYYKRKNSRKPSHTTENSRTIFQHSIRKKNGRVYKRKHCCQNIKSKGQVFGMRHLRYTKDSKKYDNFIHFSTKKIKTLKIFETIYKGNLKKYGFKVGKILKMAKAVIFNSASDNANPSIANHFTNITNKYGYKLMVCHRDFPLGTAIAETIVEYMERSRKSIICLSEDFLKGKWTMFEYEISIRERSQDMLIILLNDFNVKKLPKTMRNRLKNIPLLQWTPNDVYGKKLFFEKLHRFLGKPLQQICMESNPNASYDSRSESLVSIYSDEEEPGRDVEWVSISINSEPTSVITSFLNERNQILDTNKDLSDNIMNICLITMKKDHPDVFGNITIQEMDQPLREWTPFLEVMKIEDESPHWLMVSTHGCIDGVIRIYDSKSTIGVSRNLQSGIAQLVQKYKLSRFTLQIMNVPIQESQFDSGLHTLANIMSVIHNANVSKLQYADSPQMRQHLVTCLEQESIQITAFPEIQSKKRFFSWKKMKLTKPIVLHCLCHRPRDAQMKKCFQCSSLFHLQCLKLSIILVCPNCK